MLAWIKSFLWESVFQKELNNILDRYQDADLTKTSLTQEDKDAVGMLLIKAAKESSEDAKTFLEKNIEFLLKTSPNLNYLHRTSHYNVAHYLLLNNHIEAARNLVEKYPEIFLKENHQKQTPCVMLAENKKWDALLKFFENPGVLLTQFNHQLKIIDFLAKKENSFKSKNFINKCDLILKNAAWSKNENTCKRALDYFIEKKHFDVVDIMAYELPWLFMPTKPDNKVKFLQLGLTYEQACSVIISYLSNETIYNKKYKYYDGPLLDSHINKSSLGWLFDFLTSINNFKTLSNLFSKTGKIIQNYKCDNNSKALITITFINSMLNVIKRSKIQLDGDQVIELKTHLINFGPTDPQITAKKPSKYEHELLELRKDLNKDIKPDPPLGQPEPMINRNDTDISNAEIINPHALSGDSYLYPPVAPYCPENNNEDERSQQGTNKNYNSSAPNFEQYISSLHYQSLNALTNSQVISDNNNALTDNYINLYPNINSVGISDNQVINNNIPPTHSQENQNVLDNNIQDENCWPKIPDNTVQIDSLINNSMHNNSTKKKKPTKQLVPVGASVIPQKI